MGDCTWDRVAQVSIPPWVVVRNAGVFLSPVGFLEGQVFRRGFGLEAVILGFEDQGAVYEESRGNDGRRRSNANGGQLS